VTRMSSSCSDREFEEEQKVDKVLLTLCFLMSCVIGYGIIHFLRF
jgi:hypothetical protein